MIDPIIRCEYCAGDWLEHDPNSRRFCNTQRNKVKKIADSIKKRDNDPDREEAIVVPRVFMKTTSRAKKYN